MQSEQALELPAIATAPAPVRTVRRIQPSRGIVPIDLREVWRYRELLGHLLWRDIKARYKQTFLGAAWAVMRPFIQMVMFTIIFGHLAGIKAPSHVPYPLFLFVGLLSWQYFASALSGASSSILSNGSLIAKAYFPRIYAPMSSVVAPLVDFGLSLVVLFGIFGYFGRAPSWHIVFMPFMVLLELLAGFGVGIWLSGLTVRYRDMMFALPFLVGLWMYLTPVIYPVSLVPPKYHWLLALNPVTAVIDGFRWSLLGITPPSPWILAVNAAIALVLAVGGLFYFRRVERTIVDAF